MSIPYIRATRLCLPILLLLHFSGCQRNLELPEDRPEIWRFAIEESVGSVQYQYAEEFKQRIEDATNGKVSVVVYPYGSLGTSTQITEQLNMGVLEFAMASPGSLGKFIPELQVFLLHFIFPIHERDKQTLFSNPKLLEFYDTLYAEKGLKLLALFSEGEMVWTLKKEVRKPQDFAGVKMRVMTSPILLSAYAAYGASPTPMPYSEVYSGLQLNMIDGQVNPIFAIERQKFHEVTDWLVFPGHTSFVTSCAANRSFIESLSKERRQLVKKTIQELDEFIFQQQTQSQNDRLKDIFRDKKEKQSPLNLIGDLSSFQAALSRTEQVELLENNEFLKIHPPLRSSELAAFRNASQTVIQDFLNIGGPKAEEALELIRSLAN